MELLHRREDGSFVILRNGMPYHVTADDPLFGASDASEVAALPLEPVPEPASPTKEQLRSALADKRWRVETGGITWNGSPLSTNDRSKTLISGAASAMADGDTFKFKVAAGVWIDITGIQVRAMRDAITAHVQACFDKEAELDADITSGTITTLDQIEAAAWPANS